MAPLAVFGYKGGRGQAEPWPPVRQDDDWFGKLVLSICRKEVGGEM